MACLFSHCSPNSYSSNSQIVKASTDEELKQLTKMEPDTINVLLLGTANSGKTTILKQIKRIDNKYLAEHLNDRRKVIPDIQNGVVEYMQTLVEQSQILHQERKENTAINKKNTVYVQEIMALKPPVELTPEIGFKIKHLWRDKAIKETLNKRCYFQIDDNVEHFFNKIEEISDTAYLPDFDDYLRFYQKSIGITRTCVDLYGDAFDICEFEFVDVKGQRWARKKWLNFIAKSDAVLYVISMADYDLTCFEDNETNCLLEAIRVFRDTMVKGEFLRDKTLVILFNKFEVFQEKLRKIPITVAFDDFPVDEMNAHNATDVIQFVAGKLYSIFEENEIEMNAPLQMVRTNGTDKEHIEKIVTDLTVNLVKQKFEKNLEEYE